MIPSGLTVGQVAFAKIAIDARMYGNKQCIRIGATSEMTEALFRIDQENEYILFMREVDINDPDYQEKYSNVRKIAVRSHWYSYAEQWRLPFEMLKEKFDLIHFPHFNSPLFMPRKSVCTIHDITPLFFPGHKMKSKFRRLAHKLVFQNTISRANKVIAISEATKKDILTHFHKSEKDISVIYQGVDESFVKIENSGIINAVKNRYGLPEKFLLYVGVWRSHKNLESLVKGFEILKKNYQYEGSLVIAGRPDLHTTKVSGLIANSPFRKFIFTPGYIADADLPALYSASELFVLPSFIEGFGLIALEAQACQTPVLASDIPVLREVLADSSFFFNPKDPNDLAKFAANIVFSSEISASLKQKGTLNIQRFSWEKCARETLEIYRQTIAS